MQKQTHKKHTVAAHDKMSYIRSPEDDFYCPTTFHWRGIDESRNKLGPTYKILKKYGCKSGSLALTRYSFCSFTNNVFLYEIPAKLNPSSDIQPKYALSIASFSQKGKLNDVSKLLSNSFFNEWVWLRGRERKRGRLESISSTCFMRHSRNWL